MVQQANKMTLECKYRMPIFLLIFTQYKAQEISSLCRYRFRSIFGKASSLFNVFSVLFFTPRIEKNVLYPSYRKKYSLPLLSKKIVLYPSYRKTCSLPPVSKKLFFTPRIEKHVICPSYRKKLLKNYCPKTIIRKIHLFEL